MCIVGPHSLALFSFQSCIIFSIPGSTGVHHWVKYSFNSDQRNAFTTLKSFAGRKYYAVKKENMNRPNCSSKPKQHNICQAKEVKGQERCDQSKQQIKLIYGTFSECTQLYKTVQTWVTTPVQWTPTNINKYKFSHCSTFYGPPWAQETRESSCKCLWAAG